MLLENLQNKKEINQVFSIYDIEDMFLGAVISGVTDGEELLGKSIEWFVQKETRLVFTALLHSKETSGYCDYIAIHSEIQKDLGANNTKKLLDLLISKVPAEYNPRTASEKLEEYYLKRKANQILELIREQLNHNPANASDLFLSASESLDKLTHSEVDFDLGKEFSSTVEGLIEGTGPKMVIKTGFAFYDDILGGVPTQEITIGGGRPGHGKTTSCISLSLGILETNPESCVAVYELEMSKEALKHKYLSNVSGVDYEKMRLGKLDDEDKQKLRDAVIYMQKFSERLFIFDDIYDLTSMNKICKAKKIDVAFVDYLQLMDEMQNEDTRRSIGRTLVKAKRFAKRHNMSYLFYSQLNRTVESRDTKIPETGDLSESDLIGHIASDVFLLSYRYKYTKEPQLKNMLMWHFDKARYASVSTKASGFDPAHNKLYDLANSKQGINKPAQSLVRQGILNRKT